jgi:hypothetical protein
MKLVAMAALKGKVVKAPHVLNSIDEITSNNLWSCNDRVR